MCLNGSISFICVPEIPAGPRWPKAGHGTSGEAGLMSSLPESRWQEPAGHRGDG